MINGADDDRPFVPKDEGPKVPDKVDYEVRGARMDDARCSRCYYECAAGYVRTTSTATATGELRMESD